MKEGWARNKRPAASTCSVRSRRTFIAVQISTRYCAVCTGGVCAVRQAVRKTESSTHFSCGSPLASTHFENRQQTTTASLTCPMGAGCEQEVTASGSEFRRTADWGSVTLCLHSTARDLLLSTALLFQQQLHYSTCHKICSHVLTPKNSWVVRRPQY